MPGLKRHKVKKYPGVYFVEKTGPGGKTVKRYYIVFRKGKRVVEEKCPEHVKSAAKANTIRSLKIEGKIATKRETRAQEETSRWTFSKLFELFEETAPLKSMSSLKCLFNLHLEADIGEKMPDELVPLDLDRIRIRLMKKRKPATVKGVLGLVRRLSNFGRDQQLCAGLSFKVKMPRVDNEKTEDLTPEQLQRLFEVFDKVDPETEPEKLQVANLMKMALFTGMRRGELFRLRWGDIDFERGFILIRGPKGGKSQQIPLNEHACDLLGEHPRSESEFVFPGKEGEQRQCAKRFTSLFKQEAELPDDFRPMHGLRHVFASMLASSGKVDMYTLQKLLTHKSPQMTQRYAHLRDETLRQASELAGDLVEEQVKEGEKGKDKQTG